MSTPDRDFGRLEGKVDQILLRLATVEKLEVRVRKVEGKQHWLAGVGTAIGVAFGFAARPHIG